MTEIADLLGFAAEQIAPPSELLPSEWAAAHRVLGSLSAQPGEWDNDKTPYLVEPLKADGSAAYLYDHLSRSTAAPRPATTGSGSLSIRRLARCWSSTQTTK